jgi:hypothetical protein
MGAVKEILDQQACVRCGAPQLKRGIGQLDRMRVTMRILWYLLTILLGAFGVLALVRSIERLVTGQGGSVQILIALIRR